VSVCDNSYIFDAASKIEGANPGPIAVCPRTEAMLRGGLNSRVAEQQRPLPPETTPAPAHVAALNMTKTGGETAPPGIPCSLVLASCRKYAALRDKRAKKEAVAAEEERSGANRSIPQKNRRRTASRSSGGILGAVSSEADGVHAKISVVWFGSKNCGCDGARGVGDSESGFQQV